MALLATLFISWLLVGCAAAWALGKASSIEDPAQGPAGPESPQAPPQAKRPYPSLRSKGAGPSNRPRAAARVSSFPHRVPSRIPGRSVH